MSDKVDVLSRICAALLAGDEARARETAQREYPFCRSQGQSEGNHPKLSTAQAPASGPTLKRKSLSFAQKLRVWQRDGFRDRYTGVRVVFPGALELLSVLLPKEFPYDNPPHGDSRYTHQAMYELWPGIDHVICHVAGDPSVVHAESNLVTTAHVNNLAKGSARLEDLGWTLRPASGSSSGWDGLLGWFVAYLDRDAAPLTDPVSGARLTKWYQVARSTRASAA